MCACVCVCVCVCVCGVCVVGGHKFLIDTAGLVIVVILFCVCCLGSISGIEEESAFSWPTCPKCGNTHLDGGEGRYVSLILCTLSSKRKSACRYFL